MALAVVTITGCRREPLHDPEEAVEVRIEIDVDRNILFEGLVGEPEMMEAAFMHPASGLRQETVHTGPTGGTLKLTPGTYALLVYNNDTESTLLRNINSRDEIEAYTNTLELGVRNAFARLVASLKSKGNYDARAEQYEDAPIVFEPDHLFTGRVRTATIPSTLAPGAVHVIHVDASTVLETYTLTIGPVTGGQYIKSATIFLTGQVRSNYIGREEKSQEAATIYFPITLNEAQDHLYTVFRTFGKLPGADNRVFLDVEIITDDDQVIEDQWDVTEQFERDDGDKEKNHQIDIEIALDVPAPDGGGFEPKVNIWDPDTTRVEL